MLTMTSGFPREIPILTYMKCISLQSIENERHELNMRRQTTPRQVSTLSDVRSIPGCKFFICLMRLHDSFRAKVSEVVSISCHWAELTEVKLCTVDLDSAQSFYLALTKYF